MASTTCGRCGRLAHMEAVSSLHISHYQVPHGVIYEAAYKCPNCSRLNLAAEYAQDNFTVGQADRNAANARTWLEPHWLPEVRQFSEFEHVPEHIAAAASEATLCLSVGAYRAVGALTRAVIEAIAKDKGVSGRDLYSRIEALHTADHIRGHTKEQAHEVRHFGNDMAHGDFADAVTKEEAEEVVVLMTEILDEVYQSPARLEARKTARLAKKNGEQTT